MGVAMAATGGCSVFPQPTPLWPPRAERVPKWRQTKPATEGERLYRVVLAEQRMVEKYGLDFDQIEEMLNAQGWRCAVCGLPVKALRGGLVVDHDHESGKVRGLLCHGCNLNESRYLRNGTWPEMDRYLEGAGR